MKAPNWVPVPTPEFLHLKNSFKNLFEFEKGLDAR